MIPTHGLMIPTHGLMIPTHGLMIPTRGPHPFLSLSCFLFCPNCTISIKNSSNTDHDNNLINATSLSLSLPPLLSLSLFPSLCVCLCFVSPVFLS